MNVHGIIIRRSPYNVKETIDLIEEYLVRHGATIYARINQQNEVGKAGQTILPLEFLMFGNPKVGGVFMAQNPLFALDLPLKIISWEDENKIVQLAYNESTYLEERYALRKGSGNPINLDRLIESIFN